MNTQSSIEWTDTTWNPVRGCSIVSPGCVNCYAMKQAHRFSGPGRAYEGLTKLTKAGPQWTGLVRIVGGALAEPLSWRKPRRVFVNSMSDLFHDDVPDEFIDKVFAVMAQSPAHTFQILTKRPARMRQYFDELGFEPERIDDAAGDFGACHANLDGRWPLPNVWLGVSVEDEPHAHERIPALLQTPAAVRFISAEPLLGPIDLDAYLYYDNGRRLDWVIVGGESGSGARPFDLAWARSIVAQCKAAGVACFVKQLGALPFNAESVPVEVDGEQVATTAFPVLCALKDRKGGDPSEWPEDLRVREFPA